MSNVSKITSMGMCVGCRSCNVCEHISFKENELGFQAPVVDEGWLTAGIVAAVRPMAPPMYMVIKPV